MGAHRVNKLKIVQSNTSIVGTTKLLTLNLSQSAQAVCKHYTCVVRAMTGVAGELRDEIVISFGTLFRMPAFS